LESERKDSSKRLEFKKNSSKDSFFDKGKGKANVASVYF